MHFSANNDIYFWQNLIFSLVWISHCPSGFNLKDQFKRQQIIAYYRANPRQILCDGITLFRLNVRKNKHFLILFLTGKVQLITFNSWVKLCFINLIVIVFVIYPTAEKL